jgi:ABC-type transport system substrate-binding protein
MFTKFTGGYLPSADTAKAAKPDIAGAKKALEKAGVSNVTVEVILPTGNTSLANAVQLVQQQLAAVNIKVNITPYPSSTGPTLFADGSYDGYESNVQGVPESQALVDGNLVQRGQGFGVPDYVQSLYDQAARTPIGPARDKLYQKLNQVLIDQPVHIPICQNKAYYGESKSVVGAENTAYGRVSQGIMDGRRIGISSSK